MIVEKLIILNGALTNSQGVKSGFFMLLSWLLAFILLLFFALGSMDLEG